MFSSLQMDRGDYKGRIHFAPLKKAGSRVETAVRWLDSFFSQHIDYVSFKATFALHDGPRLLPYPGEEGYQRHAVHSTSSNVLGHIRYVLPGFDFVAIRPVFDHTDQAKERMYTSTGLSVAQFRINERRRRGKTRYPATAFALTEFQSSDPADALDLESAIRAEFLQLTDLLLGAAAQALAFMPSPGRLGRRQLAGRVTDEMARRYGRPPYIFNRHQRHFSVSLYPDQLGRMYAANPTPVARRAAPPQQPQFQLSV